MHTAVWTCPWSVTEMTLKTIRYNRRVLFFLCPLFFTSSTTSYLLLNPPFLMCHLIYRTTTGTEQRTGSANWHPGFPRHLSGLCKSDVDTKDARPTVIIITILLPTTKGRWPLTWKWNRFVCKELCKKKVSGIKLENVNAKEAKECPLLENAKKKTSHFYTVLNMKNNLL